MGKAKFKFQEENYKFKHPKSDKPESGKWETTLLFHQIVDGQRNGKVYCCVDGKEGLKAFATEKGFPAPVKGEKECSRYINPLHPKIPYDVIGSKVFLSHYFDFKTAKRRVESSVELEVPQVV